MILYFIFLTFTRGKWSLKNWFFQDRDFPPNILSLYPSLIYKNLKDLTKKDTHSPLFIIHSVLKCKALLRFPQ